LEGGYLYEWGLLVSDATGKALVPTLVELSKERGECVRKVATGLYHTIALTSLKRLYTWGAGNYGQLGQPALCVMAEPDA